MKITVNKMANGGGMPPYVYYQPTFVNDLQPLLNKTLLHAYSTGSGGAGDKNDIGMQDLFKVLNTLDGLPSDMALLLKTMLMFSILQEVMGELNPSSLASMYTSTLFNVKRAKFNAKEYEKAYKHLQTNDGLVAPAITLTGHVYARTEDGKIGAISPELYLLNKDKYLLITNAELLDMRANDPNYANLNAIFLVTNNGVGIKAVSDYLNKIISSLSSNTVKIGDYFDNRTNSVMKGLQSLEQEAERGNLDTNAKTVQGLFKKTHKEVESKRQMEHAINYVYDMLPENMKTLLKVNSSGKDPRVLITQLIYSQMYNSVIEDDLLMAEDENGVKPGSKGSSGSGSGGEGVTGSASELFALGWGHQKPIEINPGTSKSLYVNGRFGILANHEGKPLGANSSFQEVTDSQYAGSLDFDNATFGGARLESTGFNHILLKNADIVGMDLPIDQSASNGVIRPDFSLLKKVLDAETLIAHTGSTNDYEEINKIYEEFGLPPKYVLVGGQWALNTQEYARFAAVQATVDERSISRADIDGIDMSMIEEVDDDDVRDTFESIISKDEKGYSLSGGFPIFGGGDDLYRGTIFIPVREGVIPASLGSPSGSLFKLPTKSGQEVNTLDMVNNAINNQSLMRALYNKPQSLISLMK